MKPFLTVIALFICACVPTEDVNKSKPVVTKEEGKPKQDENLVKLSKNDLARLKRVERRMLPLMKDECYQVLVKLPPLYCDYSSIVVETDKERQWAVPRFHKDDDKPIVLISTGLITEARNDDELAFVYGDIAGLHINYLRNKMFPRRNAPTLISGNTEMDIGFALGSILGAAFTTKKPIYIADHAATHLSHQAGYDPIRASELIKRVVVSSRSQAELRKRLNIITETDANIKKAKAQNKATYIEWSK